MSKARVASGETARHDGQAGAGAAIDVTDLRKRYGDLQAVDGVSFSVARGETFGILGPNGAGKTTTLEIVEGLRRADEGEVRVLDLAPWPRNAALIGRIGVQLQASAFFEHLTVREQLTLFGRLYGLGPERADAALALVGLEGRAAARTERLSGGQRQRLSIALALIHDPEIVFLDEPTASLDPQARRNLWDVIRAVGDAGRTVVLTTHHIDEAELLCDRVAIMDEGRILALDTPAALIAAGGGPTRITVAAGGPGAGAVSEAELRTWPGVEDVAGDGAERTLLTHDAATVLTALAERAALRGVRVEGGTLEDVFLQLTGREYRT